MSHQKCWHCESFDHDTASHPRCPVCGQALSGGNRCTNKYCGKPAPSPAPQPEPHDCLTSGPGYYLFSGDRQDGENWTCPTCGKRWVHWCDEAEGCSWEAIIREIAPQPDPKCTECGESEAMHPFIFRPRAIFSSCDKFKPPKPRPTPEAPQLVTAEPSNITMPSGYYLNNPSPPLHLQTNAEVGDAPVARKENMMAESHGPVRLSKPGTEWIVELAWPEDREGHVAVCGIFYSTDETKARHCYTLACRIIDCWYVDKVWDSEGKPTIPGWKP